MSTTALLPLLLVAQLSTPVTAVEPTAECIACRVDVQGIRSSYSAHDWEELTDGEIVTAKTNKPASGGALRSNVETSAIIPFAAAKVWSVLMDFTARPDFMPGVKEVRIVRTDGDRIWLAERFKVWWVSVRYQIVSTLDPARGLMSWVLDETAAHDIADTTGSWQIVPVSGGRHTLVQYRARVDTGKPVPRFIENFLVRSSLPKVVEGLRAEVQRRFQR